MSLNLATPSTANSVSVPPRIAPSGPVPGLIESVTAEFPEQTQIQFLGATNVGTDTFQIYQVQFSRLGENELTIKRGKNDRNDAEAICVAAVCLTVKVVEGDDVSAPCTASSV